MHQQPPTWLTDVTAQVWTGIAACSYETNVLGVLIAQENEA